MSTSPHSPHSETDQHPTRRLKLVVNSLPQGQTSAINDSIVKEESGSPARPSYSPVTPTLAQSQLPPGDAPEQWLDEPEPLPVSLEDNPDAIALRATLSLLQMQRQQSLRDIRDLDRTKQKALKDPKSFVDDLKAGKLQKPKPTQISFDDAEESDEDVKNPEGSSRYGQLPNPQEVVRCPPIEWSKYHIVGQSLDTLHEIQQRYPGITEETLVEGVQPQSHEIAAPYRPFIDKLEQRSSPGEKINHNQ